jgi:hypothetical protein
MQLHPTLDTFYQSVLAYAGMRYDEGIIKSNSELIGDISIDGKFLTLPYFDNLKNPEGRHLFHPLNESYNSPETVFIAAYKKRLTLDINLRVYEMLHAMLRVGIDVALQRKIKSPKLLDMISRLGEVDTTLMDNFASVIKHSQKKNEEGFVVDFHVKKNGEIKGTPYAAIGKVNFILYKELVRALDDNEDGYKVFGARVRKKDILSLINLFNIVFDTIEDADVYTTGTDIKTFRFFNALLLSTYFVTNKVNDVAALLKGLKEPDLSVEGMVSDMKWSEVLEEVYDLTAEIRSIPNQTNVQVEAKGLKLKEPVQSHPQASYSAPPIPPSFNPSNVQRSEPPAYNAPPQPQAPSHPQPQHQSPPASPSVEDIIRGSVQQQLMHQNQQFVQGYPQQQPMYPQQMGYPQHQQPMYQQHQQPVYPQQQPVYPQQQPMYPQQMGYPQHQQPMYPQPQMHPGMTPEQALQNLPQGGGIPINPQLFRNY